MREAPPDFSVRVSDRARRVRLTVNARDGLVVVIPRGWRGDAAQVVAAHQAWAHRALARIAEARELHLAGPGALLPEVVELRMLGQTLPVRYLTSSSATATAGCRGGEVVVSGSGDPAARLAALLRWLDRTAHAALPPRLAELAEAHRLTPSRIRVGGARSRWGSCSARGTISLSRTLVLLPAELVDALMLHELAHLRVMDHSPRFHAFLASLDADAERHRRELRVEARSLPAWTSF